MTSKFHADLSQDLSLMLYDTEGFDVVIQVGEYPNMKEFWVHSIIMRARSPYFKNALSNRWITKRVSNGSKRNIIEFKKPNIEPIVFSIILKYVISYNSKVCFFQKIYVKNTNLLFFYEITNHFIFNNNHINM